MKEEDETSDAESKRRKRPKMRSEIRGRDQKCTFERGARDQQCRMKKEEENRGEE